MPLNQKGVAHFLLLLAAVGVIAYVVIAGYAPFKDNLFAILNRKTPTYAASPPEPEYKSDEILVKFKDDSAIKNKIASDANQQIEYNKTVSETTGTAAFDEFAKKNNFISVRPISSQRNLSGNSANSLNSNTSKWFVVKLSKEAKNIKKDSTEYNEISGLVNSIKNLPSIETAEPNGIVFASFTPNDPELNEQWHLPKISAPSAWDISQGSPSVKVAILDTGIYKDHPDLTGKVISEVDITQSSYGAEDRHGHGTHVAGIVAASINNSIGVAGVSPNISLMNVKVLGDGGSGTFDTVSSGISWAANNGASVINMSLGASLDCPTILQDAINEAWLKGAVIVAAAGNDGKLGIHTPAKCTNVVSVASTDQADNKSSFSNHDPAISIAAPGEFIMSTIRPSGYSFMSGTSMATPIVSATAALLKSADTNLSNIAVIQAMYDNADKIPQTGKYWKSGRVNVQKTMQTTPIRCRPRPNLQKSSIMTTNGLEVTITSATNDKLPSNKISKIDFTKFTNGILIIGGTTYASPSTYTPPANTTSLQFLIKQVAPGSATQVEMNVVDECGPFATFFGAGAGAGWPTTIPDRNPSSIPGSFTLNPPAAFCAGANSHIRLDWTASANGPSPSTNSGYFIYVDGAYKYNALSALNVDDPEAKNPGQTYRYKIESVTPNGKTMSNEQSVVAATCTGLFNISNTNSNTSIAPGNRTITWNMATGAVKFTLKIDDKSNGFDQTCSGNDLVGDLCKTNFASNLQTFNFVAGRTYTIQVFQHDAAGTQLGSPTSINLITNSPTSTGPKGAQGDYNGDKKADPVVFRPSTNQWLVYSVTSNTWGTAGDYLVPGDYNGDGKNDFAVFRPGNATWYINGISTTVFGAPEDIPVPGDYDGDGKTDIAVFRPSNGNWYINGSQTTQWGTTGDKPVPADYNGDGKTDIAVFRPGSATWHIYGIKTLTWGAPADTPVPADYNGDGKADIAIFRSGDGTWWIEGVGMFNWGAPSHDIPVPADYNGDGKTDVVVFRPSNGYWYGMNNALNVSWGAPNHDIPASIYPVKVP